MDNTVNFIFNFDGVPMHSDSLKDIQNKLALEGEVREIVIDFNDYCILKIKEQIQSYLIKNKVLEHSGTANYYVFYGFAFEDDGAIYASILSKLLGRTTEMIVFYKNNEILLF